jgi:hypothetical protein
MNLAHGMQWLQGWRQHRNNSEAPQAPPERGAAESASFGMDAALGVDQQLLAEISRWSAGDAPGLGDTDLEPAWAARRLNGRSVL